AAFVVADRVDAEPEAAAARNLGAVGLLALLRRRARRALVPAVDGRRLAALQPEQRDGTDRRRRPALRRSEGGDVFARADVEIGRDRVRAPAVGLIPVQRGGRRLQRTGRLLDRQDGDRRTSGQIREG